MLEEHGRFNIAINLVAVTALVSVNPPDTLIFLKFGFIQESRTVKVTTLFIQESRTVTVTMPFIQESRTMPFIQESRTVTVSMPFIEESRTVTVTMPFI